MAKNLTLMFDLSEFREGTKAVLFVHEHGTATRAFGMAYSIMKEVTSAVVRECGYATLRNVIDAIGVAYSYCTEKELGYAFSELNCTAQVLEEASVKLKNTEDEGIAFFDNDDDMMSYWCACISDDSLMRGGFGIHREGPSKLVATFLSHRDMREDEEDDYYDLPLFPYADYLTQSCDISLFGMYDEQFFNSDELSDEQYEFMKSFFSKDGRDPIRDLDNLRQMTSDESVFFENTYRCEVDGIKKVVFF